MLSRKLTKTILHHFLSSYNLVFKLHNSKCFIVYLCIEYTLELVAYILETSCISIKTLAKLNIIKS